MSLKTTVTVLLLVVVAASAGYLVVESRRPAPVDETAATAPENAPGDRVVAYYFHGTSRCRTCLTIEAYADEAIRRGFPGELADGRLLWRVVNLESPENEHFVSDFGITTRSVVLVRMVDGRPDRWKSLDEVWTLIDDQAAFETYVQGEARRFLDELHG